MHPALSVIFFTVFSGAGYGLLAVMGVTAAEGIVVMDSHVGWTGFTLGLGAVIFGLLSSTYHLGHPERAWRAFSQWRSSWLSREGVAAMVTFVPAFAFAYGWLWEDFLGGLFPLVAHLTAVLAAVTVFCTAMIYKSLKTIHQWTNAWVVPGYLVIGLAVGATWYHAILEIFDWGVREVGLTSLWALVAAGIIKSSYWRAVDGERHEATAKSATGLGAEGRVRHLEGPHTEANYLTEEMGFRIARKHAEKLRRLVSVPGFGGAVGCVALSMLAGGTLSPVLAVAGAVLATGAALVERWLFFAEARHVVQLYYGEERV